MKINVDKVGEISEEEMAQIEADSRKNLTCLFTDQDWKEWSKPKPDKSRKRLVVQINKKWNVPQIYWHNKYAKECKVIGCDNQARFNGQICQAHKS